MKKGNSVPLGWLTIDFAIDMYEQHEVFVIVDADKCTGTPAEEE